jgi:stage II sporulation protein D
MQPIEAYFHASCGGRTEEGLAALGRDLPYLRSVECPCAGVAPSRWTTTVTARELMAALGSLGPMSVEGRTSTGRADRLRVGSRSVSAVSVRQALGYNRVKSLWFELKARGDGGVELAGRGYGHGAGLCQWGAKVLAERGRTYREILEHYYPGTDVQTLY